MSEETVERAKLVTRTDAATQAVNGLVADADPLLLDRIVEWVEDVVVSSGGKPNPAATLRSVNKALKAAEGFGVVKLHKTITVERIG